MIGKLLLAVFASAMLAGSAAAVPIASRPAGFGDGSSAAPGVVRVDWQDPALLPPRFRNHCTSSDWWGRPYCENHCGRGYEFYFCSPDSFGCCHVGYGYCDWHGNLRCHP
jgi:hypothetical protein